VPAAAHPHLGDAGIVADGRSDFDRRRCAAIDYRLAPRLACRGGVADTAAEPGHAALPLDDGWSNAVAFPFLIIANEAVVTFAILDAAAERYGAVRGRIHVATRSLAYGLDAGRLGPFRGGGRRRSGAHDGERGET